MAVLDRSELEASSLADLHAIADQLGLEGFRRLRKAELIDTILAGPGAGPEAASAATGERPSVVGAGAQEPGRESAADEAPAADGAEGGQGAREESSAPRPAPRRRPSLRGRRLRRGVREPESAEGTGARASQGEQEDEKQAAAAVSSEAGEPASAPAARRDRQAEGVVELLGNGSAFLRVNPPESSREDVYISAAQVRRCELVGGDRVSGPVRAPRRSERYAALVRVETINGAPAGEVAEGGRYEDRPVAYPSARLGLDGADATLQAIEWLTPFGRGSRVSIVGPARAGKTEILRRLLGVLATSESLEVTVALVGVRPEEIAEWSQGPVEPAARLTFAASPDSQGQAVEHALESAKRTAARGGDALVAIDTLEGLPPHVARRVMAGARNLADGGSLTILATATHPVGGETTVIALDPALALAGGPPLDLAASGTVRAELLVGEDGAQAIAKARANALSGS